MKICKRCGEQVDEGKGFCLSCGAMFEDDENERVGIEEKADFEKFLESGRDYTHEYDARDIVENKMYAMFSYILILFLIPLLIKPTSKYCRFHVNQGIVLCISQLSIGILLMIVSYAFKWFYVGKIIFTFICVTVGIIALLYMGIGVMNVYNSKAKELPIIGKIRLIK